MYTIMLNSFNASSNETPFNLDRDISEIREITTYLDDYGNVLSKDLLKEKIEKQIKGISNIFKVIIEDVVVESKEIYSLTNEPNRKVTVREITIKKRWSLSDLIPLRVFLSSLWVSSIFRRSIKPNSIKDYVLNAKPTELQIDTMFRSVNDTLKYPEQVEEQFNQIIKDKLTQELPLVVTAKDKLNMTEETQIQFEAYLNEFALQYFRQIDEGKYELLMASKANRTITIKIPVDLANRHNHTKVDISSKGITTICAETLSPAQSRNRHSSASKSNSK